MRIVTATYASGPELARHYTAELEGGALFCRTRMELRLGEKVLVELRCPALPSRMLVRGEVVQLASRGNGAWIGVAPTDASTRDFVLALAQGEVDVRRTLPRRHVRLPLSIPVQWRTGGAEDPYRTSMTEDVGAGGLFLGTATPPPVGARVRLRVPDGDGAIELEGTVAWIRPAPGAGAGVRFRDRGDGSLGRLRERLRRVSERGKLELVPGVAGA